MTQSVSIDAARAPREPDETVRSDNNDDRIPRTVLVERRLTRRSPAKSEPAKPKPARCASSERDLRGRELPVQDFARLEALLAKALQSSSAPSIAAGDPDSEPATGARELLHGAAPRVSPRPAVRSTERPLTARPLPPPAKLRWPEETASDLNPAPGPAIAPVLERADERVPFDAPPSAQPRSRFARASGIAATLFSLLALLAVTALLVLLAVGYESLTPVAADAKSAPDTAAGEYAAAVVPPAESAGPQVITGSLGAPRDQSRIPAQDSPAPRFGMVRAADAPPANSRVAPPAGTSVAQNAPVANEASPAAPAPRTLDAQSAFAPPVGAYHAASGQGATGQGFASMNADAAPAASEPAAPSAVASANATPETVAAIAKPAAQTRSAAVTTHVNLRAGPENDASVLVIVPEGRSVEVVECAQWCEVIYDGRQGFIHRRFVTGAGG
jgi:hypothetical protein